MHTATAPEATRRSPRERERESSAPAIPRSPKGTEFEPHFPHERQSRHADEEIKKRGSKRKSPATPCMYVHTWRKAPYALWLTSQWPGAVNRPGVGGLFSPLGKAERPAEQWLLLMG